MKMPLKRFKFYDKPDIRLVTLDQTLFKIKLTCQHSESRSIRHLSRTTKGQEELEKAVCGILYHDVQDPVRTENFTVYPYKKKWATAKRLSFTCKNNPLQVNSYMYTFYVEPRNAKINEDLTSKQNTHGTELRHNQKRKIHDEFEPNDQETPCDERSPSAGQRTVVDYGQKNRYEVETQNLREQLRLQEMAQPTTHANQEEKEPHETLETVPTSGLMNSIKKFFGRS